MALAFTGFRLKAADGAEVETGSGTLSADGLTLTVPASTALDERVWVVEWHAWSDDGRKSHGCNSFTVN